MNTIPRNESQLVELRHGSEAAAWRTIKRAAGPTSNTQYEKALSQIGMTILQDRASDLLPYLAGFQLLDRAEDGDFAAGFFVFDANGLIVDAPLFMINGKIKGQQILFVRNSNVFVPSRDGVIRYLLSRQRQNIGEPGPAAGEPRPLRASPDIGVFSTNNRFLAKQAKAPPHFSYWAKSAGLIDSIHSIYHNPETQGSMAAFKSGNFGSGLLEMALRIPGARSKLASWCRRSPVVHARVSKILGTPDKWAVDRPTLQLGNDNFSIYPKRAEAPTAEQDTVKLYTQPPTDAAGETREKMIGEILMFGFSAEDRRKASDMNKAIQLVDADGWASPSDSGIYDVVDPEGEKHRSMVFISRDRFANSNGTMLVIRTGDNSLASVYDGDLAVPATLKSNTTNTLRTIYDKLEDFKLDSIKDDDCFLVISPEGVVAGPFTAHGDPQDGVLSIRLTRVENQSERPPSGSHRCSRDYLEYMVQRDDYTIFETTRVMGQTSIIVPKQAKIIKIPLADGDENWSGDPKEFRVLAISAIDLRKLNNKATVKIARYTDKLVKINEMPLTNRQAGWVLIKQAGLPASFVMDLLKTIDSQPRKYAIVPTSADFEPWHMATSKVAIAQGPMVPQNMTDMHFDVPPPITGTEPDWFGTPSQQVTLDAVFSPMSYGDPTSPKANPMYAGYAGPQVSGQHDPQAGKGPDSSDDGTLEDISKTPEKLFENKTFLALIRKARVDTEISKYVEALFKLCDQTGRILFLIYAHPDEFADFYGEKDVDTLEEQLLTMFESGGDLLAELLEQSAGTSDNITLASMDQAT